MSTKRILTIFLVCLWGLLPNASAQSRDMDPDVKNYKLSMDKIKAYDGVVHKVMSAAAADPAFKSSLSVIGTKKTLNEMAGTVEQNAKLMAIVKPAGITAREFCVIPMGVMAAGTAYMIKTQYKKDPGNLATPENIAFYEKNQEEVGRMANTWTHDQK